MSSDAFLRTESESTSPRSVISVLRKTSDDVDVLITKTWGVFTGNNNNNNNNRLYLAQLCNKANSEIIKLK